MMARDIVPQYLRRGCTVAVFFLDGWWWWWLCGVRCVSCVSVCFFVCVDFVCGFFVWCVWILRPVCVWRGGEGRR